MRKCVRCGSEMNENYSLKIESFLAGVASVRLAQGTNVLSDTKEKVKVAVCPKCGELSIYVEKAIEKEHSNS